ncbi:hypothetical protein HYT24_02205 [Candidatus Pacearchaeota archaeon]|nr:hypothetical protein [Candidatus Pacearchaeota archaeon]
MAEITILQNWIVTKFILPFVLVFAIVFAVLEKTGVLGTDKKQLNAMVAFVVGLIFVGVVYPKEVVGNMILFLSVALVIVFVLLVLWGFLVGESATFKEGKLKYAALGVSVVAVVGATIWAMGIHNNLIDTLFYQPWSKTFWTNAAFVVAIAAAIAIVLIGGGKAKSG